MEPVTKIVKKMRTVKKTVMKTEMKTVTKVKMVATTEMRKKVKYQLKQVKRRAVRYVQMEKIVEKRIPKSMLVRLESLPYDQKKGALALAAKQVDEMIEASNANCPCFKAECACFGQPNCGCCAPTCECAN